MTTERRREIVIEFEKVQLIRKRAATVNAYCEACGCEVDSVLLIEAARLFEIDAENLLRFLDQNGSHYQARNGRAIYLCVPSLLKSMEQKTKIRRLTAKGD